MKIETKQRLNCQAKSVVYYYVMSEGTRMRDADVKGVLEHVASDLSALEKSYWSALRKKKLPSALRIDVKNVMENLRSCLDYMAQDINDTVVTPHRSAMGLKLVKIVYFPYGKTKADFDASVGRNLPDLGKLKPKVLDLVESIQPYKCGGTWLYDLCSIVNSNKHDSLSPQERAERKMYKVGLEGEGPAISAPAGAIKAPPGAIRIGGRPVVFDPESGVPLQTPGLDVKITVWVDFKFESTEVSVLPLLQTARDGIEKVSKDLYAELT